jgi:hypothetical protein
VKEEEDGSIGFVDTFCATDLHVHLIEHIQ